MLALLLAATLAAPDVFFISVDTLRADHLGCYGHEYPTSPTIDALAARGRVFEDCVCEVPLTAPSLISMNTGRLPRTTGTTRNGLRLPDHFGTVAEVFRANGYTTWCVQSNWTVKAKLSGLDRGFDVYDDDFSTKRWLFMKPERYGRKVTNRALNLLEKRDNAKPLFFWIHYTDPHAPYRFHRKFAPAGKPRHHDDRGARVKASYDSEVAYTDYHISRLLEAVPEDALILFIADHGESLWEHDYLGHGRRIYQTGMHIPLIIAGPGIEAERVDAPVRGLDVGRTLLGLAGLEAPSDMRGINLAQGPFVGHDTRVVETYGGAVPKLPGFKKMMADKPPQYQGVLQKGWKLIVDNDGEHPELYYLPDDPMEETDLAQTRPDKVEELRACIVDWNKAHLRGDSDQVELDDADIEALESLGYLD